MYTQNYDLQRKNGRKQQEWSTLDQLLTKCANKHAYLVLYVYTVCTEQVS